MPPYVVKCVNRETGAEYPLVIGAEDAADAVARAAAEGHLAGSASAAGAQGSSAANGGPETSRVGGPEIQALLHEVRGFRNDVRDLAHRVERAPILRSPTLTIAWGIIFTLPLLLALAVVAGLMFGLASAFLRARGVIE